MEITGSKIIVETLIEQGVDTVFGYPGGAVLHIYDALYDYKDKIHHIMTSHEQGAAHAADGYARSTGKTGVVIATSGPGATNIVTGIATAYMDSIPMVCITGNVAKNLIGKDSFQEVYITGVTMPVTKHNFLVKDINDLANTIREAFRIANTGRKGPVLIDIPKDITNERCDFKNSEKISKEKNFEKHCCENIDEIAEIINMSKRPVIYAGGGVVSSEAATELRELMNKALIPACNTIMGIGILGDEDELNLGMVGMHGKISTNYAIENSDLLLAIGVRFSDRVALNTKHFAPNAKIIHIDIDNSEINKNVSVDYGIVGDVKQVLNELLPKIDRVTKREEWFGYINSCRNNDYMPKDDNAIIRPHQVIKYISEKIGDDGIFVTDVGQHQMWTAQFCGRKKVRKLLTSGGLGTMGYGYGAAIGAKVANPGNKVVLISGDGSFHMNMNECATAVKNNIPIIAVIMNNFSLGMPRQWQHYLHGDRYSESDYFRSTDYVKLADAFGAKGYSCRSFDDFRKAFDEGIELNIPIIIECIIDRNEQVLPMIPAGGTVEDIIVE